MFGNLSAPALIALAVVAVALLVTLVTWRKVNAILALLIAALLAGTVSGLAPLATLKHFQDGIGATLGGVALVIALGAMLGCLLAESGGAQVLAVRFQAFFGPARVGWCIIALALTVGLVTWFAVGLYLLLPILLTLSRESRRPMLSLAIPLLAFLSVMHGLMPPHPGPVVAVSALGANTGMVLALGLLVGIPTAAIAGPLFARWAIHHVPEPVMPMTQETAIGQRAPSFITTVSVMMLPLVMMLGGTAGELLLPVGSPLRDALAFFGHPVIALTSAVMLAGFLFGRSCGFSREKVLGFTEKSASEIGMTLLVVAAGGGFARVLTQAGIANALGQVATNLHLPPLVYGWLMAAFIRVATGSATVAITAAAGLVAPLLITHPELNRELLVLSLGFGSLILSHLNDGGFWIVKNCLGLTVGQTLRTWTLTETIIGVVGLILTLALDMIIS